MKTDVTSLAFGDHRVDVVPTMGAVASWSWRGQDLFRPSTEAAIAARDPLGLACFAMAPWVSRVRDSRFNFHGRLVALKPEADPRLGQFAIHGEVWRAPWSLTGASTSFAEMRFRPGAGAMWPWDYECAQTVSLDGRGLTITLSLRSESETAFPYTFGLHPYFARRTDSRLTARVTHRSILSPDGMPLGEDDATQRWRDEIMTRGIQDHCYRGWDGLALISHPGAGFRIRMQTQDCSFLQVYAPDDEFFCVEPQTGGPNALNRGADGGVRVLDPRAVARISVCFTPEPI